MSQLFLAVAYLIALHTFWLAIVIPHEVKEDLRAINEDGSKDSLKKKWHRLSALKIGFYAVGFSTFLWPFGWYVCAALVLCLLSLFWKVFDEKLSEARGLPKNYVGYTAEIDRFYRKEYPDHPEKTMQDHKTFLIVFSYLILAICFMIALI